MAGFGKKALFFSRTILVVLIITTYAVCALREAYATSAASATEEQRVAREHVWDSSSERPVVSDTVEIDGVIYHLEEVSDPVANPSQRVYQTYTYSITKEVPVSAAANIASYFPESHAINDGSFVGAIPRVSYSTESVYESWTGQVDKTAVLSGLENNDLNLVPTTMNFSVRSDSSEGATTTATLRLLDVRFEQEVDALGRPVGYTAYMTFRGQESWLELDHYVITANYAGEIESSVESFSVTATYVYIPEVAASESTLTNEPTPLDDLQPEKSGVSPLLVVLSAILLSMAIFLVWLLFIRSNIRLVRRDSIGDKTLIKRQLAVVAGEAVFKVPIQLSLDDGAEYVFYLKPRLANQAGYLVVVQDEMKILEESLKLEIILDMEEVAMRRVVFRRAQLTK